MLIINDVRSAYNVGSMLRTADGLGVDEVFMTGYTAYPESAKDIRLPHISKRAEAQIAKTALGAEKMVKWRHAADGLKLISDLKRDGYLIAALEQTADSKPLGLFKPTKDIALIVGNEISGIEEKILAKSDVRLSIPMGGEKESFNVSVAAAIALYHLKRLS